MNTYGNQIRQIILTQSRRANKGHIGSALSIADLIAVLYEHVLEIENPEDPERDRFVLGKGHAVLAQYAALYLRGWISQEDLNTYCGDDSQLGVHPEHALRGIDFTTGSLGHSLSMAAGAALAARMQGSQRKVYALLSDAECNEGAIWEAVMFAAHHHLNNLTVLIDANGQQAIGYTHDVIDQANLGERWRSFGWEADEVDGHDAEALRKALQQPNLKGPRAIIAHTTFGKGVSYMESQIAWHYWPMTEEQYRAAMKEVGTES